MKYFAKRSLTKTKAETNKMTISDKSTFDGFKSFFYCKMNVMRYGSDRICKNNFG